MPNSLKIRLTVRPKALNDRENSVKLLGSRILPTDLKQETNLFNHCFETTTKVFTSEVVKH